MWTGFWLSIVAWLSVLFMWKNMPQAVKLWTLRHHVLTDIITGVVVYYSMGMFSRSIVCMEASLLAPFWMNLFMWGAGTPKGRLYLGLIEPPRGPGLTKRAYARLLAWIPQGRRRQ